jgi:hypothetical protein
MTSVFRVSSSTILQAPELTSRHHITGPLVRSHRVGSMNRRAVCPMAKCRERVKIGMHLAHADYLQGAGDRFVPPQ